MPKREIRHRMLELRRQLSSGSGWSSGIAAQELFLSLDEFAAARSVALYSPIRNEVDTALISAASMEAGKTVCYPAVVGETLEFRRLTDPLDLVCGRYGICEPPADSEIWPPETIDLFLVPGVAFALGGERIGYGKGYYDKALHKLEGKGRLIGFCYDFQLVEAIAGAAHDVLMDAVVTDRRVLRPRGYFI